MPVQGALKIKLRNHIERFQFELNVCIERANSVRRSLFINILLITYGFRTRRISQNGNSHCHNP